MYGVNFPFFDGGGVWRRVLWWFGGCVPNVAFLVVVVVVFTLHRPFYPASSVHPVSVYY